MIYLFFSYEYLFLKLGVDSFYLEGFFVSGLNEKLRKPPQNLHPLQSIFTTALTLH